MVAGGIFLDLSHLDTSIVHRMSEVVQYCTSVHKAETLSLKCVKLLVRGVSAPSYSNLHFTLKSDDSIGWLCHVVAVLCCILFMQIDQAILKP